MANKRKIAVFNHVSLDGYFTDQNNDMSWAHRPSDDREWNSFVENNAGGGGVLLFGRVTYEMMAGFWPTAMAAQQMPVVAEGMNKRQKYVVSKTMDKANWENTTVLKGDLVEKVKKLKEEDGETIVILGSGSVIAQLTDAGLIDEYQVVVNPVIIGKGRTMFENVSHKINLRLTNSRTFKNGNVLLSFEKDI